MFYICLSSGRISVEFCNFFKCQYYSTNDSREPPSNFDTFFQTSLGGVWGLSSDGLAASALVAVAALLFSPLLAFTAFLGAAAGTMLGEWKNSTKVF